MLIGQLAIGYVALFVFLRSGSVSLRPGKVPLRQFIRDFVVVSRNLVQIGGAIAPAQREVIFGKRSEFVRTPKSAPARVAGE